jgi:putative hydrolase of the HAD superfamily
LALEAIFFDAGGTLIFPDRERTLAPLKSRGITFTQEQLHAAERTARQYRDRCAANTSNAHTDEQYWVIYYQTLLGEVSRDTQLLSELVAAARTSANWTFVPPDVPGCLEHLKGHYRLAVISNSDGRIADVFARLNLSQYFEAIFDSGRVGHQKPSRIIFETALRELNIEPQKSVYIGDVYSIDYTGAQGAGMNAILIDPYGTYANTGVPRVQSICELQEFIERKF